MGVDDKVEPWLSASKFPFAGTTSLSPEHPSGMATPPLHALASVPFRWEEQPGKPRPCTDIIVRPEPAKGLELPPCRMTKISSPTTVLDGPDMNLNLGRPKFSSFRLVREKLSSFDSSSDCASPHSAADVLHGSNNSKKKNGGRRKMARLFGRIRLRRRRRRSENVEHDEGSFGFSPSSFAGFDSVSMSVEGKATMTRDNRSLSSISHSQAPPLWATMYESLKQVIPWKRTRKSKKESAR